MRSLVIRGLQLRVVDADRAAAQEVVKAINKAIEGWEPPACLSLPHGWVAHYEEDGG